MVPEMVPGQMLRGYYLFRRLLASSRGNRLVRAMDRERDHFYKAAWSQAAAATGATVADRGDGFLRMSRGAASVHVNTNYTPLDSQVAALLSDNKPVSYRALLEANIPVPRHIVVAANDRRTALAFLREAPGAVVAKPASGTGGGIGVSTNISTPSQLVKAIAWAGAYCRQILIERQIEGETYRLVYLDGTLLDAVVRGSPRLVGDGATTVARLVENENAKRLAAGYHRSQTLLMVDQDMKRTLARQELRLSSVPEQGCEFVVKRVVNENIGMENETVTDRLCSAVVDVGRRTVETLGLRLAGIDIITSDPGQPLQATGGVVIDVNAGPGLFYHYKKKGGSFPLAEHILRGALDAAL